MTQMTTDESDGRLPPDGIHRALKRQASLHGWSLQCEIQSILASAVGDPLDVPLPPLPSMFPMLLCLARWAERKSTAMAVDDLGIKAGPAGRGALRDSDLSTIVTENWEDFRRCDQIVEVVPLASVA